jgi:S-adenosylmethionine-diacylglycerol 3-amino-3-carboxypropyl transferase
VKKFFSRLSYSIGNEDWRTEERALNLQPGDHVLCITASGDRPLNLLIRPCKRMVCVDANRTQNHLLDLKIAAMKHLSYVNYLAFLGAIPGVNRLDTLKKLSTHLNPSTANFWFKHKKMIEKGILYQGEVERITKMTARLAYFIRGKKIRRLFEMDNLESQRKFVQEEWNGPAWKKFFEFVLNPLLSRLIIQDPGLSNIGKKINPGSYIYERIHASLHRDLAKNNLLLSLILKGQISSDAYSPYLTKLGIQMIKNHLKTLEIYTQDIVEYIESIQEPTFDAFSLSDVASYLSYTNFVRLLRGIVKAAKPGARFCLREFLSSHEIPPDLQSYFKRDLHLEKELEEQDNCFVYRFMVGTVNAAPVKSQEKKHGSLENKHFAEVQSS